MTPRRALTTAGVAAVIIAFGVLAFASYGTVSTSGSPKQRMLSWVQGTGLGQDLGTIHDDDLAVAAVVSGKQGTGAIHTTCGVLVADTATATSNLPTPDSRATELLDEAYVLEYRAGDDCYNAGAGGKRLLARSAAERAAGSRLITEALQRIAAITGTVLPTTTTTSPGNSGIFG
ncbi:MAG TPA: hypothetical protein VEJ21_01505 [Acidimicrobiales bacterium]|nr:hypothetical protein [Acidimicrobiales bacterium]